MLVPFLPSFLLSFLWTFTKKVFDIYSTLLFVQFDVGDDGGDDASSVELCSFFLDRLCRLYHNRTTTAIKKRRIFSRPFVLAAANVTSGKATRKILYLGRRLAVASELLVVLPLVLTVCPRQLRFPMPRQQKSASHTSFMDVDNGEMRSCIKKNRHS